MEDYILTEDISTIKGYENYTINKNGEVINSITGHTMSHVKIKSYNNSYYMGVALTKDKKQTIFLVHRLLAIAFISNPSNYPIINHIDGNKLNNSLDNLEWCTYSHNNKQAYETGLRVSKGVKRQRKRKIILNITTGIFYFSVKEALDTLPRSVTISYMYNILNGKGKIKNNTTFIYT